MVDAGASVQDQQLHAARELSTSKLLVGVSSGLSLLGALVMIAHFLAYQESRRCGRRLLFCLHLADAGAACAWLLMFVLPAVDEDVDPVDVHTARTCTVQVRFDSLASCFWTACFAFYLFQLLAGRSKAPELCEDRYHLVAWGIPAATVAHLYAQTLAGTGLVGESGRPWCWIRSWSDDQWSVEGFYVQLVIFYVPVVLIFLHNLVTYVMLLYSMTDSLSTSMETRVHYRLLLYSWAFFLPNVWIVFAFAYQAVAPNHALNAPLLYLVSFFTPLQGLMNAIVYGVNRTQAMDTESGELVASFLSSGERRQLRAVSRRWLFTCTWLQFTGSNGDDVQPRKSQWNFRSRAFRHNWNTFIRNECQTFLPRLLELLPAAAMAETMELKKGLCLSTNTGQRPSFENTHARSGYIQQKINRCGNLPNLLLTEELSEFRSELFRVKQPDCWNMALYGGGPGYDALGLVFMREYLRAWDVNFHTTVYDNEPGWKCAIDAVGQTLEQMEQHNASVDFQLCDITFDVHAEENSHVSKTLKNTQLHVFSFVCAENFCLLRGSAYVFLRSLFSQCSAGSYFIFTDSTHRLWPAIFDVAKAIAPDRFRVWTPFARSCHFALVLQKLPEYSAPASTYPFYSQAMEKLQDFRRHQQQHLKTMEAQQPTPHSEDDDGLTAMLQ
ncbi:hypothetical protein PHYSODRAFT_475580 [Phytophthora sojae]|uniref:G-protein coupled receptors family 2 profile 2 domain-containing protein n=1 Tax=Phytophthora sojae (strain P6497) TaxID=1094619 RepID=G4YMH6_PHYSP|nr:hypothetical protein PHYSODRAFT_475580 [Phytophthora sojae]EGZ28602.1 hypothetical protein PHYSODRAFT_475580 [Phytophthora sojae]|eukprot:XP_009515877.1 hypothetical protein PHYSODRAFT_475580 [Phytophthora sojae]